MPNRSEFAKLQLAAFVSQAGSHFLTISLAAFVLVSSGSIVQAALVFVISNVPSVVLSGYLGDWIDRSVSRKFLATNEVLSIVVSVLCGVAIAIKLPLAALCAIIGLRSILLFVSRAMGTKWLKVITPAELQAVRFKFFSLIFFLSTAAAGILASNVLTRTSMTAVIVVDVATYLVSLLLILSLRELPMVKTPTGAYSGIGFIETVGEIMKNQTLRAHFTSVCFSQAIFQGAYSVLVSYLPIQAFGLGPSGIGPFQLAASIGIIVGFLVVWRFPVALSGAPGRIVGLTLVGITALLCAANLGRLNGALIAFCLFHLCFECIWLFNNSEFFRKSGTDRIGRYQFTLTAGASLTMAAFTLGYSVLIESIGIASAVPWVVTAGIILWLAAARLRVERHAVPEPKGTCL